MTTNPGTTSPAAMTTATAVLLLRDRRPGGAPTASLTATVQRARIQRPPHPQYRLELTANGTHMVLTTLMTTHCAPDGSAGSTPLGGGATQYSSTSNVVLNKQTSQQDEGFESDIDSLSIVSSDSINQASSTCTVVGGRGTETDSANGSACSDDSDDNSSSDKTITSSTATIKQTETTESYNLVNVLCYTDVTCPDLLVVLIDAGDTLVFRFSTAGLLTSFYASFTALKAVSQQRTYSALGTAKFNLLHRTDTNGITHIEISRDRIAKWNNYDSKTFEPSSIISLDTPGHTQEGGKYFSRTYESRQRSLSTENILDSNLELKQYHSLSFDNLLGEKTLRKVWSSAENLLDAAPIKPERRKRVKQRAPQPPVLPPTTTQPTTQPNKDYTKSNSASKNMRLQFQNFFSSTKGGSTSKAQSYQPFKYSDPKHLVQSEPRTIQYINPWSSTVPRLLRPTIHKEPPPPKPKTFISHLSTAVPMRYVHHQHPKATVVPMPKPSTMNCTSTISNRLFGMSGKLKDFSSVQCGGGGSTTTAKKGTASGSSRWSSLGELTGTYGGNLKSVIKKEDQTKKSKEKKVTFSDFTTVKVL